MEKAQDYLERCLDILKKEPVSETTMIIMFHEYAKLYMREYSNDNHKSPQKKQDYPQYGC